MPHLWRPPLSASGPSTDSGRVPARIPAVLVGLAGAVFFAAVIPYTDGFLAGSELAGCHFPVGPVVLLFLIILPATWLVKRLLRREGLAGSQALYSLSMFIVAAGLPTFGLALYLFPILTGPFYMASPENKWAETFFGYLPEWLTPPPDGQAVMGFYESLPPGAPLPWGEWAQPLVYWTILALALYWTMLCLASLVRKQWTERENLIFPLVQLPLEMVLPQRRSLSDVPFFRNRLMWVGFAIPVLFHTLNSLHEYFPTIPTVNWRGYPIMQGLAGRPWSFLRASIYVHFSVIGFAYFLTTEISLSLWLFHWLDKLQHVVADGFAVQPVLSQIGQYQYQGAFVALVGYGLWVARGHLGEIWRGTSDDAEEALRHRVALGGIAAGGVVVCAWLTSAGVSLPLAAATFALFLVICWGMARLVGESGILFAKATQMVPTRVFNPWIGADRLGPANLAVIGFVEYIFMYDLKAFLMPQVVHSLKMSDVGRLNRRHLAAALGLAVVAAVLVSYVASLKVAYSKSAVAMHPWFFVHGPTSKANMLTSDIRNALGVEPLKIGAAGVGAAFFLALSWMRQHFVWFPLHPLGYVAAQGFEPSRMWFPFLLGWAIKGLVTRYGSVGLYRQLRAPFLGLVLGEYSIAGLWVILDAATQNVGHRIFP